MLGKWKTNKCTVAGARLGGQAPNKELLSAKKKAFCDVKNLLGTNTPNQPSKSQVSGLKKPVFGTNFKANIASQDFVKPTAINVLRNKNYKPRIDLSTIDYSDNEPHSVCKSSSKGSRDIMHDFWSVGRNFEIFREDNGDSLAEIPEMPKIASASHNPKELDHPEPMPNLFDDSQDLSFCNISFDDF